MSKAIDSYKPKEDKVQIYLLLSKEVGVGYDWHVDEYFNDPDDAQEGFDKATEEDDEFEYRLLEVDV